MPNETTTRPTSDRVREAMFSTLSNSVDFAGASVLDLYAGSGALGFEAVSRGATNLCAVERAKAQLAAIKDSAREFGLAIDLVASDVLKSFARIPSRTYDIVFADPPYADRSFNSIVAGLLEYKLVGKGSVFVFECDVAPEVDAVYAREFELIKEKKYGSTLLQYYSFYPDN
jgi:16S rRNA (guanine966-N2)-methyltransferase